MSKPIVNTPSPNVLMNSMRSIGYSFQSAIADIIDNSISAGAKNIWITTPINDEDLYITILDDGFGMDSDLLFNAMKYGSDRDSYGENDLGRFGLGLKTASLSQCRILTVASKKNGIISAYQWNYDAVAESKAWNCLELDQIETDDIPQISSLKQLEQGTLVVWQNFDIIYKKSNGHIREMLSEEMDYAERHIRLVFHRFLNNNFKPLKIYINQDRIIGYDPFLEDHHKTDATKPSEMDVDGSIIKIQTFILPHQNDLSNEDLEKIGGIESLRNDQGFYIYRNDRLIIYGTWFRLASSSVSSELYKYGRIKVDIPNTLDDMWEIDIKKQNAVIPKTILNKLKKAVSNVTNRSKEKTSKRTRLTIEKDDTKIWNKKLSRNGKDQFFINEDSEYIRNFLDDFSDNQKGKILKFLDILSTSIPYDDIYSSICNKNTEISIDDETVSLIVAEGISQFNLIKSRTQKSSKDVFEKLTFIEPFNDDVIASKIWEAVKDE